MKLERQAGRPARGLALLTVALGLALSGCGGGGSAVKPEPQQPGDTTPPRITSITGIADGQTVVGSAIITATASDDVGVASFKLTIDGQTMVDAPLETIHFSWDVHQVVSGDYALQFEALDSAGNVDRRAIAVKVDNPALPLEAEPAATQLELTAEPVVTDEYVLPAMKPELFNPNDREPPKLIISGIRDGEVVYRTRNISVLASDDTGVNALSLVLDGQQLALESGNSLEYTWDTTFYEDGAHQVSFIVRDNGGTVGRCELHVTVDNTTDYYAPEFDFSSQSYWVLGTLSGPLGSIEEWSRGWGCCASGEVHLKIKAVDAHEIAEFNATVDGESLAEPSNNWINYVWQAPADDDSPALDVKLYARDILGNETERWLNISLAKYCTVHVGARAANGVELNIEQAALVPGAFDSPGQLDLSTAVEVPQAAYSSGYQFWSVPAGRYTIYIRVGNCELAHPIDLVAQTWFSLTGDRQLVMPTSYPDTVPNRRVAVVTGTEDDLPAVIEILRDTDLGYFVHPSIGTYYPAFPETLDLVNGDGSLSEGEPTFMEFVMDRSQLYQHRYIFIESGNAHEAEWATNPQAVSRLKQWVSDGGQLVVTGKAYDFVEQMFPQYVDFAGDDATDGLGAKPEALGAAESSPPDPTAQVLLLSAPGEPGWYYLDKHMAKHGISSSTLQWSTAGWIMADAYAEQVRHFVAGDLGDRDGEGLVKIASVIDCDLGRVVLLCFPVQQPNSADTGAAGVIMDFLAFSH